MDGILSLWKERGMTSHDCVFQLRKILQTKKIGHGGTLDPDVEGVLPICVGRGTKVIEYMVASGKTYVGEITLGFSTTTEDKSGEEVERTPLFKPFADEKIDEALRSFIGTIAQKPPMYSAVKINGKKLYEYARKGIEVERAERQVTVASFERVGPSFFDEKAQTQTFRFRVACGKGVYVRTLAVDVGKMLGVPSHMSDLVRVQVAGLSDESSHTLAEIQELKDLGRVEELLLPIEVAISSFPRFEMEEEMFERVKNGACFQEEAVDFPVFDTLLALFCQGKVIALYEKHETKPGVLKPRKVLRNE